MGRYSAFETRYLAFLDLLGLSNFVRGRHPDAEKLAIYNNIFEQIRREKKLLKTECSNIELSFISDSIVLSTPVECDATHSQERLTDFLWAVRKIGLIALSQKFLVRGAIVRDSIVHVDSMLFGEAIIRAYGIESRIARYPRIILAGPLGREVERLPNRFNWLRYDADGPVFLHLLRDLEVFISRSEERGLERELLQEQESYKFLNHLGSWINWNLRDTRDEPSLFEKHRWFAEYFNEHVLSACRRKELWPVPVDTRPNDRRGEASKRGC